MRFLLLSKDGKPLNHGIIVREITPEKFLCQFARNPPVARVCDISEIQNWNLFPTDEALNAFISSELQKLQSSIPNPDVAPDGSTSIRLRKCGRKKKKKKKTVTKKAAKKSSRRKSNGKK